MGKKILDSKALYVFLSVLIAVALWFYITSQDGNERTETINNIPVTFVGEDTLEARGLMIVGKRPTGSVRVTAAPAVLSKLRSDTIKLTVNVSQLEEAAEYTLAYTASLPSGVSSDQAEFVSGGTGNVSFTVARYATRQVEIRCVFTGTVADGYLPGAKDEFIYAPERLTISGQSDLVNQVAYARVTVDGENLTNSISGEFPFELIGASGNVLEDLDVEVGNETIYVSYPILATAEIQLAVKLIPGGGVSEDMATYKLSTEKITVAGSKEAVAAISGMPHIIETVNLADVEDGDQIKCIIPLADELTNISGITDVTITIQLNDSLQTRIINATNISVGELPEGWSAKVITQQLAVEIRGKADFVESITEDNVRVVADLSDINLAPGQYTVPATIYLDSIGTANNIGVVGTDYKVVVSITED